MTLMVVTHSPEGSRMQTVVVTHLKTGKLNDFRADHRYALRVHVDRVAQAGSAGKGVVQSRD